MLHTAHWPCGFFCKLLLNGASYESKNGCIQFLGAGAKKLSILIFATHSPFKYMKICYKSDVHTYFKSTLKQLIKYVVNFRTDHDKSIFYSSSPFGVFGENFYLGLYSCISLGFTLENIPTKRGDTIIDKY